MPISPATLQRRFAELGRIRLGAKQSGNGRPMKLAAFRFTSPNKRYIEDLAVLYGGTPQPWDNNGKPEHEVFTDTTSIPVIAMKGGLSQWMETWSGGGCVHRCDGEFDSITGEPCNPEDRGHRDAKPTTRLSLMLPELDAIGAWRMESHGWNAAAEIPAVAELAQFVGDLVPAHLNMIERRSVRDGRTSRFVVPVLDLQIGAARLREIVAEKSGTPAALEAGPSANAPAGTAQSGSARELQSSASAGGAPAAGSADGEVRIPTPEQIAAADLATARQMLAYLEEKVGEHPATAAARARVAALTVPDDEGIVDADVVAPPTAAAQLPAAAGPAEPEDCDALWQQIVTKAGQQGMTLPDLQDDFAGRLGVSSAEASAAEMRLYVAELDRRAANKDANQDAGQGERVPA